MNLISNPEYETERSAREAYEAAYAESFAADDTFEAALKAFYGPKATRWDHRLSEYPLAVKNAYLRKVDSDEARVDTLKAWRRLAGR